MLPIRPIRLLLLLGAICSPGAARQPAPVALRVATFNLGDVATADLLTGESARLRRLAEVIQRVRPNVVLLNEIAYDSPGAPDVPAGEPPGRNARRFVENYLATAQAPGLRPLRYEAFMAATNTGMPSGFDLDHSGAVVTEYPAPGSEAGAEGARAYGGDCWGYGAYPGQYGMALLVDARLDLREDEARTFRLLPWDYVPGAFLPKDPDTGEPWFTEEQLRTVRLSSKSHWDVPVGLPNGSVVHFLCSHPTPPAFDGPEMRNKRRNFDEIRFWADYIAGEPYIVDDANGAGGLPPGEAFVILGDLNADPDEGDSFKNPIGLLLNDRRIEGSAVPVAEAAVGDLDPDDTAGFGLRVDYVLPSRGIEVTSCGVWRQAPTGAPGSGFPSDHFPVWADLRVPPPAD
ncbi:MAG TPA: endonuclease/exonuclease/phosphatase family protein [Phycisphaerales bacterium]|nr:endonuclease/exonuclease/phosphatase family protein [Phycisphaerales bacterium]